MTESNNNKDSGSASISGVRQDLIQFLLPEINEVIIDRYKIQEEIGRGGFGSVFKVFDLLLSKTVALKFLDPKISDNEQKFHGVKREINISQKITDEKIVKIFSLELFEGKNGSLHFLVMDFIKGKNLRDIFEKEKFNWDQFKPIYLDILQGVKVLHKNKIIHRDLKPSNIIITGKKKVVILDFGLSKEIDDNEKTSSIGEIVGSPDYISPEQITKTDVDYRSDIYQLGLILYRVLAGKLPFTSDTSTMDIIFKRLNEKPKSLKETGIKVQKFIQFGIDKALERKAEDRFKSISEMIEYFEDEHYPFLGRTIQKIKKSPRLTFLIFLLLILSSVFTFIYLKNIDKMDSVKHLDTVVTAYNPLGFELWKRDFKPDKISRSFKTNLYKNTSNYGYIDFTTDIIAEVFITNSMLKIFAQENSILDENDDNQYVKINSKGKVISRISYTELFFNRTFFDFSRRFYISRYDTSDIDNDGIIESMMLIRHAGTMYPSAFSFKKRNLFRNFTNPGAISHYWYIDKKDRRKLFLLKGRNNLISHLDFIAEVDLTKENVDSIPNFHSHNKFNINSFMVFLPTSSNIITNRWEKSGEIELIDSKTKDRIIINSNYKMEIDNGKEKRVFMDDSIKIQKAYNLINTSFKEKNKFYNLDNAYKAILKALELNIQNPYLVSALFHIKGDIEVAMGQYKKGKNSLNLSLKNHPNNADSIQKLCEIDFLRGDFNKAIENVKNIQNAGNKFWGLNNGEGLFLYFCSLSNGDFISAKEFSEGKLNSDTKEANSDKMIYNILKGIYMIFKGDYRSSKIVLKSNKNDRIALFTVPEFRLFYSRAILLDHIINSNSKKVDLERAHFYFRDLSLNTYSYNHYSKISELYFELENNREFSLKDIENALKSSFDVLVKKSKGDFFAKFWLFYDSYIYAAAMEKLNNRSEAVRGFEISIKANPHTDLARRAERKIRAFNN